MYKSRNTNFKLGLPVVNIVRLRNGSRKRVHGAISHYGPRSSARLSTWLFSKWRRWKRAFKAVTRQFNIENLLEEQQKSLREFSGGYNIFVKLLTGFGNKSLIFQCLPIAADALFARPLRLKCCGLVGWQAYTASLTVYWKYRPWFVLVQVS